MSTLPVRDQQQWEYRRLFVIPRQNRANRRSWKQSDAGFVENLVETIEDLEEARCNGWKLLSVKLEEDDDGRCWLNAYMKRRKTAETRKLPDLGIEKAA